MSRGAREFDCDRCLFTIPRVDVKAMGLLKHQFYKLANKNEAGDMVIYDGELK